MISSDQEYQAHMEGIACAPPMPAPIPRTPRPPVSDRRREWICEVRDRLLDRYGDALRSKSAETRRRARAEMAQAWPTEPCPYP
jgi:hypothetical protein